MTQVLHSTDASLAEIPPEVEASRRSWVRKRRMGRLEQVGLGIGVPIALIGIWELASAVGWIDPIFFPSPSAVVDRAWKDAVEGTLAGDLGTALRLTLVRLLAGFAIGTVGGLIIGLAMGNVRAVRFGLGPLVSATYPMPKIAILPLLLVLLGIGDASKIALIAIGVFFMVALNTLSGVLYSNPVHHDVARAFGFSRRLYYRYVVIPSAMPSILTGIRLGIGQALILVVSVEFVSSNDGLGYFIWNAWQILDVPRMFVGLAVVLVLGALAAWLGDLAERRLVPWAKR